MNNSDEIAKDECYRNFNGCMNILLENGLLPPSSDTPEIVEVINKFAENVIGKLTPDMVISVTQAIALSAVLATTNTSSRDGIIVALNYLHAETLRIFLELWEINPSSPPQKDAAWFLTPEAPQS